MSEPPHIEFDGVNDFFKGGLSEPDTAFTPTDIDGLVYWWTSDEGLIYPTAKPSLVQSTLDWLLAHPYDFAVYILLYIAVIFTAYAFVRTVEEIHYDINPH